MDVKRKHPRIPCDLPCRIVTSKGGYDAKVVNISLEGVYLESEILMDEGTHFGVLIDAGGGEPVGIEVELVHWSHMRPDTVAEAFMGYGVRVSPPTPEFRALVDACADMAAERD